MDRYVSGPYEMVETNDRQRFPFYLIEYDRHGTCLNPQAFDHLMDEVAHRRLASPEGSPYSNIFLFCHGWNNDRAAAVSRYRSFLAEFQSMWFAHASRDGNTRPIRPILVGILWPSAILTGENKLPSSLDDMERDLAYIKDDLEPDQVSMLWSALADTSLDEAGARLAAQALRPAYDIASEDDSLDFVASRGTARLTVDQTMDEWRLFADTLRSDPEGFEGFDGFDEGDPELLLRTASWIDTIKAGIRATTVRLMKHRAGVVGRDGVSHLLESLLLSNPAAHLHVIGHSYGCKVLLSAIQVAHLPRAVTSALLLQPAISAQSFAPKVDGTGLPGGYRRAIDRRAITHPIFTTFSSSDFELHRLYHFIFVAPRDPGELSLVPASRSLTHRFRALGGHGPQNMGPGECRHVPIQTAGNSYAPLLAGSSVRVFGLDGSPISIRDHGDIVNQYTAWALYHQVTHA